MGKRVSAKVLAFLHFASTEMRCIWLLWYTIYSTTENAVTSSAIADAFKNHHPTRKCLYDVKITVPEIQDCMQAAYQHYLAYGDLQPYKNCNEECPESQVWIEAPEPRLMVFFITAWLFGFLLVLFVYCIYRQPDYDTGSYIQFTQTLYGSKAYKIVANLTSAICVLTIVMGILILIREEKEWTGYLVAFILAVMASRSLLLEKSDGFDIKSEKFCRFEISRGNSLMMVLNFFMTTNAALLDEMEVQVMRKWFQEDVAGAGSHDNGCLAYFNWCPLSDESMNEFLASEDQNNGQEMAESS